MIYFAWVELGEIGEHWTRPGIVKIGMSGRVDRRIEYHRQTYRRPVTLLATIPGGFQEETEMHRRFRHLRVARGHRCEWYYPTGELMDFIESIKAQSDVA